MYTEILRSIEGVGVYPVISLLMFVAVFTIVLLWAIRADRTRLALHAALPLSDGATGMTGEGEQVSSSRRQA